MDRLYAGRLTSESVTSKDRPACPRPRTSIKLWKQTGSRSPGAATTLSISLWPHPDERARSVQRSITRALHAHTVVACEMSSPITSTLWEPPPALIGVAGWLKTAVRTLKLPDRPPGGRDVGA